MAQSRLPHRASFIVTGDHTFAVCGMDVWCQEFSGWAPVDNPMIRDLVWALVDARQDTWEPSLTDMTLPILELPS